MKLLLLLVIFSILILDMTFSQCIRGDCKSGLGTYTFANGDKYVGEWKAGKKSGQGTYTYPSGSKYIGEWKAGKKSGLGTYTFDNGDKYIGEWKAGKKSGLGTYTFDNGDKYVGEWKDGKKSGLGTYTYPSGSNESGVYEDGKLISRRSVNSVEAYLKQKYSKQVKPKYPAFLTIENLQFTEPSNNHSLDGFETGKISLNLVNKGKGYATNIEINISPLSSGKNLEYASKTSIDKIHSKSSQTVEIPITASIDAKSMERKFRIEVTEHFGFDADPATISFTTTAFDPPDLQINQIAIDDNDEGDSMGNDNSIIEPGESIEVTAFVQNLGGDVEDLKAEVLFNTDNQNISFPDEGQIYNLGDIVSGDYKEFKFYFYTSRRYDEVDLPISVKLTESKGKFGKTIELGLKAGERTQNVVDVQIARVEKAKRDKTIRQIEGIITLSDVDKNIPKTKTNGKNTLAVIIGVEDYKYAPEVDFAGRDAQYFYEYSKSVLGVPEPNIYYRVNEGATSGEFNKIFAEDGWIARRLGSKTDIIFYYSGHGAPDPKSEKGYLIPHDIDPNYPNTGFSLDQIYQSLADLNANSITVFIDACFSGESRAGDMLVAGLRPISIQIANPVLLAENFSVLSASTGKQYSSAYPEKFHGLFTYFLLKGLQGSAKGGDNNLTISELYDYVRENVSSQAGYLDKEQDPTFIGTNKDKIVVRY